MDCYCTPSTVENIGITGGLIRISFCKEVILKDLHVA